MMVEAGVAEEVSEDIQHEAGLPSKDKLTRPEFILFMDNKDDRECGAPTGSHWHSGMA
jgi:hypothetical protein